VARKNRTGEMLVGDEEVVRDDATGRFLGDNRNDTRGILSSICPLDSARMEVK
jgi:hypothetical protein